jgi:hypothetical protein
MAQITLPIEKKQNYPGLISLWCGVVCILSAGVHFEGKGLLEKSLYTSTIAGYLYGIGGTLWFLSTALGLLCWFISLFLILPIWRIRFRTTGIALGILLPMLMAGIIMPTLGKAYPRASAYYPVSDPAAIQYIQGISKTGEKIDRQFIKNTYEQEYSDYEFDKELSKYQYYADTITVKYELSPSVERKDLPKSFTVLIDRKTKKTEIKQENDIQQKAE